MVFLFQVYSMIINGDKQALSDSYINPTHFFVDSMLFHGSDKQALSDPYINPTHLHIDSTLFHGSDKTLNLFNLYP